MSLVAEPVPSPSHRRGIDRLVDALSGSARTSLLMVGAVALALATTACLILLAGTNPITAYGALVRGAFGSLDRVIFGINKATPYILAGAGVALCFRAKVINIGAEGQIAVGGIGATFIALNAALLPVVLVVPLSLAAGALCGAIWAGLAAIVHLKRGVHEVLCTLLLNFVGVLLVSEVLHGDMGEPGAGFPQSPLIARVARLPKLISGTDLHIGILLAVVVVVALHVLFWRTTFGFRLRIMGESRSAADYVGLSVPRATMRVMLLAGGLAGLAGGIEVLGVHLRLIEGFSAGFGFNAVAVALLASLNPLAVLPAGLFLGFLEAGALAMQREVGVPSSLVFVIQGLTMIFVLCAIGIGGAERKV
ncbi:ABC transporter permease [Phreatobacter aquaticus]|uniref:ABC transporter permease n=1 Tax=Phreatobacter aquaticus TaxID=2570229 RepID=A0A4D7QJ98_9HYPH|nr:ABC transporter permease [Phreatobacter aquaticus]QCK87598.1 ABC transporter permease [Phreatobacter aquaticus]